MADREKMIKAIEICYTLGHSCTECPLFPEDDCNDKLMHDVLALLKEQEPKTGHWIFDSTGYEAWTHTCSECEKRMTTAFGMYANFCWNCGAKMTGGEM